jgi:hypothetical protein
MMREHIRVKGMVSIRVLDKDGNIKRRAPGWFRRLLRLRGRPYIQRFHNIVTREGDAIIADALLASPTKTKVSSTSGYIQVGTGWTGNGTKTNNRCNNPTGAMKALDEGYPLLKAAWGTTGDNTLVYRATFAAGLLNANGINETCLLNGNQPASNCFCYAQVTPTVNVTANDTLQIVWEVAFLGQ